MAAMGAPLELIEANAIFFLRLLWFKRTAVQGDVQVSRRIGG